MKILYAIQGTGNGHICRAKEVIPYLKKYGELDLLISGIQSEIELPFEVKYRFKGVGFVFGKKGGIDLLNTYIKSHLNSFIKEVKKFPIQQYDLVISDFEPIAAWAAYFSNKPCVALSNQCSISAESLSRTKKDDVIGKFILNYYAPSTSEYGFHFESNEPHIFTPIIRREVRELVVEDKGHYTVYLPAYNDKRILKKLLLLPDVKWQVFSKKSKEYRRVDNVEIFPISADAFLESLRVCTGVLTAAGFGTTSEALFLNKKLMVIPQKNQFEQNYNAVALKKMGVPILKHLRKKYLPKIEKWLLSNETVKVDYPDQTELIIETIVNNEYYNKDNYLEYLTSRQFKTTDNNL